MSTTEWAKFFENAGIPISASAQYAVAFRENRIKMDMLMDLNKEYLKDMGIVKLGDIIAILKHAKSEDGKRTTEKVYKSVSNLATEPKTQSEAQVKANDKINRRPEAKTEPKATVRTVSVKTDHLLPSSSTTTSKLTSRLGPPAPKSFLDLGIGAEKSAKEDIFKRLDKASTSHQKYHEQSAFGRLDRATEVKKSPSQPTKPVGVSESKRIVMGSDALPSRSSSVSSKSAGLLANEAQKKPKTYLLVKTHSDGSKTKEYIDEDDPILEQVPIKKMKASSIQSRLGSSSSTGRHGELREEKRARKPITAPSSLDTDVGGRAKNYHIKVATSTKVSVKERIRAPVSDMIDVRSKLTNRSDRPGAKRSYSRISF